MPDPVHDVDVLIDSRFDQRVRWSPGERLDHLFEQKVDSLDIRGQSGRLAVDSEQGALTYAELDCRANRLARHLAQRGVRSGDRVGLLFDHALDGYTGMLATLKLNAAYVPLDPGFPTDRIAYICHDADVRTVVTCVSLLPALESVTADAVAVDAEAAAIAMQPAHRLDPGESGLPVDELAYVIYTSGTTGRPKGVAIEHASICNFVRVAAEVYGITDGDRIYQGMTIAFDFSVEEIWVPWMAGATLVPKPYGAALVGEELHQYLQSRRITALCCVPTLLATLEDDLPGLRFLLVSGEACPQDLITRWYRPDRRFLNVYGPTEATVTATWTPLDPDHRVTIGVPLPTYSVVLLDPQSDRVVTRGGVGEICVGGVALSPGYVHRPDLTAKAFIQDSLGLANNPSGRLYRTGDLGRIDEDGNIEYLGRIDLQVKIRGYRIELTEIESVLMQYPGIATAVVEPHRPEPDVVELAAYYCRRGDSAVEPLQVQGLLRDRLPGYMVPSYLIELEKMPMLPSDKVDRKRLPPPGPADRLGATTVTVDPEGPVEHELARLLAEVLRMERVGVTSHFFDDLGGDSLVMARFCARVREHPGLGHPVMQDVYRHPTIRDLASALVDSTASAGTGALPAGATIAAPPPAHRVGRARYAAIGAAQALTFMALTSLSAFVFILLFDWLTAAPDGWHALARSLGMASAMLVFLSILPVVAKWLLVGRTRVQRIPVWGAGYYHYWVVRWLLGLSPARLAAGTPVFIWYLRLLGARVGRNTIIHGNTIPAFPDLLTIGSNVVICPGTMLNCYRVDSGVIRSGPVTVRDRAFVGGHGVLDIDTVVGQDAQLAHSSSLAPGQRIPAGESWHGTPAVPGGDDHRTVPDVAPRPWRGVVFGLWVILTPVLLAAPLFTITWALIHAFPVIGGPLMGVQQLPWTAWPYNLLALGITLVLIPVGITTGLVWVFTVPRLVNRLVVPGRVYPLYGLGYVAMRMVMRMTNARFGQLFGDSNYITGYLSLLGYRMKPVIQTGTNFGMFTRHDIPYLVRLGTGTMVSDGIIFMNAEYSSTAFRVGPTEVGAHSFFGNDVLVTPRARIGDNVLLATKVLVPVSGAMRHDVGLLGSPAFEIPRSVMRDAAFDDLKEGPEHDRLLQAKLRYNTMTIVLRLLTRWFIGVLAATLSLWAIDMHQDFGSWPMALVMFLLPLFSAVYFAVLEQATMGFRSMQPQYCSIYNPYFWRHERFWKLQSDAAAGLVNGTPFKAWLLRLHGARIGRQLFDDGSNLVERSLVTIGDYCTLNLGSILQGHSLEDGTFKSDVIVVEDGVTLAPKAFVHYGTHLGRNTLIDTDAFLMKGEQVPDGQWWHANPARPMPSRAAEASGVPATVTALTPSRVRVRIVHRRRRAKHRLSLTDDARTTARAGGRRTRWPSRRPRPSAAGGRRRSGRPPVATPPAGPPA
ncbi:non-ribosomal peptide synthetase-like protein [Micrococcus sp. TA1]|nr:non-ribosomal peptide synthetase-like protein [Micrococcus sp. TA1]